MLGRFWTCPFLCAACSAAALQPGPAAAFRMGCHKLPRDTRCWLRVPRLHRLSTLCQQGVLGDEKHLVFECPALQDLRDRYENLFQAPRGDAMILFMWQDDIIGVARFMDACLERLYASAGPPTGDQTSD